MSDPRMNPTQKASSYPEDETIGYSSRAEKQATTVQSQQRVALDDLLKQLQSAEMDLRQAEENITIIKSRLVDFAIKSGMHSTLSVNINKMRKLSAHRA